MIIYVYTSTSAWYGIWLHVNTCGLMCYCMSTSWPSILLRITMSMLCGNTAISLHISTSGYFQHTPWYGVLLHVNTVARCINYVCQHRGKAYIIACQHHDTFIIWLHLQICTWLHTEYQQQLANGTISMRTLR